MTIFSKNHIETQTQRIKRIRRERDMLLKKKKLQQKFKELKQRQKSRLFSCNITVEFTLNINNASAEFDFFNDDKLTVDFFDNTFSFFEY